MLGTFSLQVSSNVPLFLLFYMPRNYASILDSDLGKEMWGGATHGIILVCHNLLSCGILHYPSFSGFWHCRSYILIFILVFVVFTASPSVILQ